MSGRVGLEGQLESLTGHASFYGPAGFPLSARMATSMMML